jgi:E3 ubiquitin-protein ligase DOA10
MQRSTRRIADIAAQRSRWWMPRPQLRLLVVSRELDEAVERDADAHHRETARPPHTEAEGEAQAVARDDGDGSRAADRRAVQCPCECQYVAHVRISSILMAAIDSEHDLRHARGALVAICAR